MPYDYSKLLGRMKELSITQDILADKIGLQPSTLSLKLNNKAKFKQSEISEISEILNVSADEIGIYFFFFFFFFFFLRIEFRKSELILSQKRN